MTSTIDSKRIKHKANVGSENNIRSYKEISNTIYLELAAAAASLACTLAHLSLFRCFKPFF